VQQQSVEGRLVAQQQQPFRIRVQPSDGIDARRKTEFRQRPVGRAVAGESRQDAVRFVERDKHVGKALPHPGRGSKKNGSGGVDCC